MRSGLSVAARDCAPAGAAAASAIGPLFKKPRRFEGRLAFMEYLPFGMLVALGPIHSMPCGHLDRTDEQQASRFGEGWLKIFRTMLAEIPYRHPPGDFDPSSAEVRFFQNSRLAFHKHAIVVHRGVVNAKKNAGIALNVLCPGRFGARNDIESAIAIFKPARHHVGPAILIGTAEPAEGIAREEFGRLLFGHPANLTAPFFVLCLFHDTGSFRLVIIPSGAGGAQP